jgi:uncharacterized membrane protein
MPYPIKLSAKTEIIPAALIVAAWILAFYFYAHFPAVVVTHWGIAGEPNGFSGRATGAFAIPALLTGMYALFLWLPWLDPKAERYGQFAWIYQVIKNALIAVLFGVYLAASLYNLGYPVRISLVVPWLIGLLMIVLGNYMGKIKPNWFVGVRTPWTLSSEDVWNKTNRFGGFMMVVFGVIIIITPLLPKALGIALFIAGLLLVSVCSYAYSFVLYKKEKQKLNG